jgi:hypothetical protein
MVSQSPGFSELQVVDRSAYFTQVVLLAVEVVVWVVVDNEDVEDADVEETLVVVPLVSVVDVFEVVVRVVTDEVSVVVDSELVDTVEELVAVRVVQYPHVSSHIPAWGVPELGAKMVSHRMLTHVEFAELHAPMHVLGS